MLEFLEGCEALNMQPLLAVYAGYSINGTHVNPGSDLQAYVQDALDEIQYITGSTTTTWGAKRAADGHPAPFPLIYVEVGNEDFFDNSGSYDGRFAQFFDAIRSAYPNLKIIATANVTSRIPDIYDQHFYQTPRAFQQSVHQYDNYSPTEPNISINASAPQPLTPVSPSNSSLLSA